MIHKPDLSGDVDLPVGPEYPTGTEQSATSIEEAAIEQPVNVLPVYESGSEWDAATKRTAIVILLISLVVIVWLSRPVIPILITSGLAAYLLSPIVDLCERLRIPRSISTITLFLLLLFGVIVAPIYLVPILVAQLTALLYNPDTTLEQVSSWIDQTVSVISQPLIVPLLGTEIRIDESARQFQYNLQQFVLEPSLTEVVAYLQQAVSTTTNIVGFATVFSANLVGGILQLILTAILTFFVSLYLTMDAPKIRAYVQGLFPPSYQSEIVDLIRHMSRIWQAFFRGQIILALIIGFVTWGSLVLVGMPGALVLGIFAGAMEVIPNLGPTLAMIPAVIVALIQGSTNPALMDLGNFGFALVTLGIYFIIQQLENSIIVPRVIGVSVNLHPVVVICGVIVGFNIWGILGAFLAAPMIASLRVLGGYVHAKLLGNEPFLVRESDKRRPLFYRRTVRGDQLTRRWGRICRPRKQPSPGPEADSNEDEALAGATPDTA